MSDTTIVTALFDLGRGDINNSFERKFDDYISKLNELLSSNHNIYLYCDSNTASKTPFNIISPNIHIKYIELEDLKKWFGFYDKVNEIRTNKDWYEQVGWLGDSPQAKLDMYNPLVMSKFFMLNDATFHNPFKSEYFYWIDSGITNTVHPGYFFHDKVFNNLSSYTKYINNKFTFISYPYEGSNEIHGFKIKGMEQFSQTDEINYVCRGGFFGGRKREINELNSLYWNLLNDTLNKGYMGTEESIFTIMSHLSKDKIQLFWIEGNGLIAPFFEYIKDKEWEKINKRDKPYLYILTYNSPSQLTTLLSSFISYDDELLDLNLILINNSTDENTFKEYDEICDKFNIHEFHYNNIGICGGRQKVAEHFDTTNSDFYLFFEDDMNFYEGNEDKCKLGFRRKNEHILSNSLEIMIKEKYDFLKLSFTEFFGDNSVQWAWYNIPQHIREQYFPKEYHKLPTLGQSPNPPKVEFNNIKFIDGLGYIDGEVYYDNWPAIFSREGNKKIFLDTKWEHPYEQTWMSYVFQKQKNNEIKSAVLLLSPIEHDRFDHYPQQDRREN